MIKRRCALILLTVFFAIKSNGQDYNVLLKIDGIGDDDTALIGFVSVENSNDEIQDKATISNGILNYKFKGKGMYEGIIVPHKLIYQFEGGNKFPLPASRIHFYINNGDVIKIDANVKDKIVTYTTAGNDLSKQRAEADFYIRNSGIYKERLAFEYRFNKKNPRQWTMEENKTYTRLRSQNDSLYSLKREEFILSHLNYEYSPKLILEIQDKQKAADLYSRLTPEAKTGYFGKVLRDMINGWAITTPGVLFPDFNAKTVSNTDFNLKDYKGKYVLLDFWGSWCGPCVAEIPQLKKLQHDYAHKLVVVGMVCNDTREKIRNTIKKYSVDWIQLFDSENKFPSRYGVRNFPTKILIDKKGIVVKIIIGTSEQKFVELEKLLK